MSSIHGRLLAGASLVLALFVGVAAFSLERAYRASALQAESEKLQAVIYGLLAAAEETGTGGMRLPAVLPQPELASPDSGLVAWIPGAGGEPLWRSASLLGAPPVSVPPLPEGSRLFRREGAWFVAAMGIGWEDDAGRVWPYTLVVAERATAFDGRLARYRGTLALWLGGLALGLLLVQGLVLRWGLAPLRRLEADLRAIRDGGRRQLGGGQPRELEDLAMALDQLLAHDRAVQARYRNNLDDLAHGLKGPLAVLRNLAEEPLLAGTPEGDLLRQQLERMERLVAHRLQRAAASGRPVLAAPVEVARVAGRLVRAMEKVHAGRGVRIEARLQPAIFPGDENDLMELLGNLLDNACRYGGGRVRLQLECREEQLRLTVEDDGPGVPAAARRALLSRGTRLDEREPGQGLGLAVVREIVALYGGELALGSAGLGGLQVRVTLPGCRLSPPEAGSAPAPS